MFQPPLSYLVIGSPRSGSSLLCEKLSDSGVAGQPDELFARWRMRRWGQEWETDSIDEYVSFARRTCATPNGVFGAKLLWEQLQENVLPAFGIAPEHAEKEAPELLSRLFSNLHYVLITRRDRLRQAISWEKAEQTWNWRSDGPQRRSLKRRRPPMFDYVAIQTRIEQLQREEERWRRLLCQAGQDGHEVTYEELAAAPEEVVRGILDYLDIEAPAELHFTSRLQRQSDEINDEWEELFLAVQSGTCITYEREPPA